MGMFDLRLVGVGWHMTLRGDGTLLLLPALLTGNNKL